MSYLLLPADERDMVRHLRDELGWTLITGRISDGAPETYRDPDAALSDGLPSSGDHGTGPLWVFVFWSAAWGPAVAVRDAPEPRDVVRRTLRAEQRRSGGDFGDVVDPRASPIALYRRCFWDGGRLGVGFLNGMDRPRRDWPAELRHAVGQAERWLKRSAVRINPFDYVDDSPAIPNVVTWVRPAAWAWLEDGGRIAPVGF